MINVANLRRSAEGRLDAWFKLFCLILVSNENNKDCTGFTVSNFDILCDNSFYIAFHYYVLT